MLLFCLNWNNHKCSVHSELVRCSSVHLSLCFCCPSNISSHLCLSFRRLRWPTHMLCLIQSCSTLALFTTDVLDAKDGLGTKRVVSRLQKTSQQANSTGAHFLSSASEFLTKYLNLSLCMRPSLAISALERIHFGFVSNGHGDIFINTRHSRWIMLLSKLVVDLRESARREHRNVQSGTRNKRRSMRPI